MNQKSVAEIVNFLKENGAGSIVKRSDAKEASCGFLTIGTLRNDDSLQRGPDERVLFGARGVVGYPIESVARYMAKRGFRIESRS